MRKAFTVLAASLCLLASCNLEGEKPLEEGVMTPDEFFKEIEVSDAVDLEDGWWKLYSTLYQKDNNGNYKKVPFYGSPVYYYYYYMQNGKITSAKRCAQDGLSGYGDDAWEDFASGPVEIAINKEKRTFSFVASSGWSINDCYLRKCDSNIILTIDFNSEKQEDGKIYYWGHNLRNIGEDLSKESPSRKEPSYYDENGYPVYETL